MFSVIIVFLNQSLVSMSYTQLKSWPFVQAHAVLEKINFKTPEKGYVLFETGYGPSGLPHIGFLL
jgi:hypothetical protein